ncbi:unnamed protein product, partial [Porites lobata]
GVCTYVRTNLNYRIRNDLNNDLLESLFVEISKPRSTPFLVGTCQLITEPTRVTQYSKTLIDLCITNSPEKITN